MKFFRLIISIIILCSGLIVNVLANHAVDTVKQQQEQLITGDWKGSIDIMGRKLEIIFHFKMDEGIFKASIDIPMQNVNSMLMSNVKYNFPEIHMEMLGGAAVFDGKKKKDTISGTFKQAGMEGTFTVKKSEKKNKDNKDSGNKEKLPYDEEEVEFKNGDIKLAGTLTLPRKKGKHPAVIMITGSGPQNRDEELFGMKPFRVIADHFTRKGIAVLRYDDRGVGGSTGDISESTTIDFADDVLSAVQFLKNRNDINFEQIGMCGHSEGGIVAPAAAVKSDDVAFIILIAGTGRTGEDIIHAQSELISRASGLSEERIRKNIEANKKFFGLARKNAPKEEFQKLFKIVAAEQMQGQPPRDNMDAAVEAQFKSQYKRISSPWFKFFLDYDPAETLEKVKCPVLMVFGGKDLQVPAEMNEKAMVKALKKGGNSDYKVKTFPDANHLFQKAVTGNTSEYNTLPKEFLPGFLEFISDWTLKRVDVVK